MKDDNEETKVATLLSNKVLDDVRDIKKEVDKSKFFRPKVKGKVGSTIDYIMKFLTSYDDPSVMYEKLLPKLDDLKSSCMPYFRAGSSNWDRLCKVVDDITKLYQDKLNSSGLSVLGFDIQTEEEIIEIDQEEPVTAMEIENEREELERSVIPSKVPRLIPQVLKKYDICFLPTICSSKWHYNLVVKVSKKDGLVWCVTISSSENGFSIGAYPLNKSRVFKGFAINSVVQYYYNFALSRFVMQ